MDAIILLVILAGVAVFALGAWMLVNVARPIGVHDFVEPKTWCRSLDAYREAAKARAATMPAITHCGLQPRRPIRDLNDFRALKEETASPSRLAAPMSLSTLPRRSNITASGGGDQCR